MVESLQRIAWAAGVGGLAYLAQLEQIHQLYRHQVTMRPPEMDDTNLVRESLEVCLVNYTNSCCRGLSSGAELCIRPVSLTATTSTAKTTVEHFCN